MAVDALEQVRAIGVAHDERSVPARGAHEPHLDGPAVGPGVDDDDAGGDDGDVVEHTPRARVTPVVEAVPDTGDGTVEQCPERLVGPGVEAVARGASAGIARSHDAPSVAAAGA
jgi:hypothetical protein